MPFTPAHPAAILPLYKWSNSRLPLAALAIGSMTPDAPYFFPWDLGPESHSLLGILYFDWPVGMALWILFEYLLKYPTLELMPPALRARLDHQRARITIRSMIYLSLALMLGACTHIVWDSFTHAHTPVVARLPLLRATVVSIGGNPLPLYKFLQWASSVVGLSALTYAIVKWWRKSLGSKLADRTPLSSSFRNFALVGILAASLLGGVADYLVHPNESMERRFFFFCIGGMTGLVIAWCAVATLIINTRATVRPEP